MVYQAFLPLLKQSKGRIINVGSIAGISARPFRGSYTVSKFSMEGLSDTMRQELSFDEISVSMINPGYIRTALAGKNMADSKAKYGATKDRTDLRQEHKQLLLGFEASYDKSFQLAPGPETTTHDIMSALTDPKPRTRYYPGSLTPILPAWLAPKLKQVLPDRFMDKMVLKMTVTGDDTDVK